MFYCVADADNIEHRSIDLVRAHVVCMCMFVCGACADHRPTPTARMVMNDDRARGTEVLARVCRAKLSAMVFRKLFSFGAQRTHACLDKLFTFSRCVAQLAELYEFLSIPERNLGIV